MDESFVNMFMNSALATANPWAALTLLFLFFGRIMPIIAMAPFFGARILPHPVKVTFAISLFVIFLPKLLVVTTTPIDFNMMALLYFAKEMFIGFILGFIISIPFTIVQSAGIYVDHQRGGASLMVNDPTIQNQSSPLGTMFNMVLIYIFFLIDGPFLFIDAIMASYDLVPPDKFINPYFFEKTGNFWDFSIKLMSMAMRISVRLATPALLAILMTDVFLGITNRLAQQVQITFLGLPLKSLLGLGVICIGWRLLTKQMATESYVWLRQIDEILLMLKPPFGT